MTQANFFGTDGLRGTVGQGLFTRTNLASIGNAIGYWFTKKIGKTPKILIARDTRASGCFVQTALASGLISQSCILVDAGILPTPAAHYLANKNSFDGTIVISASHNAWPDNGIKIMLPVGKLSEEDEYMLSELIRSQTYISESSAYGQYAYWPNAENKYISEITNLFKNTFKNLTIVLDTGHGATCCIAPVIFENLGAQVITINNKPDGFNINKNCGSLYPDGLIAHVLEHKADIGFAFDGDGDRVIAVTHTGELKDGDDILAILSKHPVYEHEKSIVGTLMTNESLACFVGQKNHTLIRTAVGDRHVTEALVKHNLLLGGETAGHIILRDIGPTGDGIATALRVTEIIHRAKSDQKLDTVWEFKKFPQKIVNIKIPLHTSRDHVQEKLKEIIARGAHTMGHCRMLVRLSGTEPVIRILTEAPTVQDSQDALYNLQKHIEQLITE